MMRYGLGLLILIGIWQVSYSKELSSNQRTFQLARTQVTKLLKQLEPLQNADLDMKVSAITQPLHDKPYTLSGETGEGDWQPNAFVYKGGARHINQWPVYRLDKFNCQTFVQVVMAMLYSRTLDDFDKHYINISYGAASNPQGERVRFYNRNHFVDGDFNPINERNGYLTDVTGSGPLAKWSETTTASITRQRWFATKKAAILHVDDRADLRAMSQRFDSLYLHLPFARFPTQKVIMHYLPKARLALLQADGSYRPNLALLNKIPTPAVAEIIYDSKKWVIFGRKISEINGSELTVGHLGVLYRQAFKKGQLIYHAITCQENSRWQTGCKVQPVFCTQERCSELMFVHATSAYPKNRVWTRGVNGAFYCEPLTYRTRFSPPCNRVEALPFFAYLTSFQHNRYWYMRWPAILGVHVERLNDLSTG